MCILASKFCDVLSRWKARELSAQETGEILGCSERQFRRYRRRYDHTHRFSGSRAMRTNIDIDNKLMAEAQKAGGQKTKKQTVEQALRLMIRLRRQQEVDAAFWWRGRRMQLIKLVLC
jgi:Arc/MetJ family transcription regulator